MSLLLTLLLALLSRRIVRISYLHGMHSMRPCCQLAVSPLYAVDDESCLTFFISLCHVSVAVGLLVDLTSSSGLKLKLNFKNLNAFCIISADSFGSDRQPQDSERYDGLGEFHWEKHLECFLYKHAAAFPSESRLETYQ